MASAELATDRANRLYGGDRIFESDAVTLWYYPELKIVHHRIHRLPTSDAFRELLTMGAELLARHGASKWLSDDRGNLGVRDCDVEWGERVWRPRAIRNGFKYWAIVLPTAAVGKLNMDRLSRTHGTPAIISSVTESPQAAFEWLKAQ